MSNTAALRRRITHLLEQIDTKQSAKTWAFILLNNAEIPPDARAHIGPRDTVYTKRIMLHG